MAGGNPFDPGHLIGHVKDSEYFEVPRFVDGALGGEEQPDGKVFVPQLLGLDEPLWSYTGENPTLKDVAQPLDFHVTKFMVIELFVAVICVAVFGWLAGKISTGARPQGKLWNMLEGMLLFIRDQVARPAIGKHDADHFLPFLWTLFFFILGCNLFGMLPWMGSPTGSLAVTGALALITFLTVVGAGMFKMGPIGFWVGQVPHMELPFILAIFLKPMIFFIEVLGMFIKHFVLAVRLLANMMAGHLVLAVLVAFVAAAGAVAVSWLSPLFIGVSIASILGATALSLLELFVAFLQAYIFTFLAALFIGMAVHPH